MNLWNQIKKQKQNPTSIPSHSGVSVVIYKKENKWVRRTLQLLSVFLFSILLTMISLYYSVGQYYRPMFFSYFGNPWILFLNWLPTFFVCLFFLFLTGKSSLSTLFSSIIIYGGTLVSFFKMKVRSDPVVFEDVLLINEAINIQNGYTYTFSKLMFLLVVFIILISLLQYFYIDRKKPKFAFSAKHFFKGLLTKLTCAAITLISFLCLFHHFYLDEEHYAKTENAELIKYWATIDQYISRGFLYSFLHSYTEVSPPPPEGYNASEAAYILENYTTSDIPEDKKVNVISIMLEAYNDFSKYEQIEWNTNPYEYLDKIREEAYYGELITDIFAGGTVDTERKFITGYSELPTLRKHTNSYAHYFASQGYTVEGSHCGYNWFYNRQNVNQYFGFQNYYFFEDKYQYIAEDGDIAKDNVFLPELYHLFQENKSTGKPYFSFNVTYQNHGPYPGSTDHDTYFAKLRDPENPIYEDVVFNNYLWGIGDTNRQLYNLVSLLKEEEEPVVLIFFGDHNPWLGNDNIVYTHLGINLDLSTEQGTYNYYSTPYVIWANDAAKEVLENDFVGQGPTIGPYYLMSEFFSLAGYEGNNYMKFTNTVKEHFTAINPTFLIEDGEFVREPSEPYKELYNQYLQVEYYWKNQ